MDTEWTNCYSLIIVVRQTESKQRVFCLEEKRSKRMTYRAYGRLAK